MLQFRECKGAQDRRGHLPGIGSFFRLGSLGCLGEEAGWRWARQASPTFLEAGGTLENAQAMAADESPRTTELYDRTGEEITLDKVERITI